MPYNAIPQGPEGEGDVNEAEVSRPAPPDTAALAQLHPADPMNNSIISAPPANAPQPPRMAMIQAPPEPVSGTWAIQIGAYSSHDASMAALRNAKEQLPARLTSSTRYMIVPLMTNRGVIYRARMAGLDRVQAATACRVLQGSCVVLAIQ